MVVSLLAALLPLLAAGCREGANRRAETPELGAGDPSIQAFDLAPATALGSTFTRLGAADTGLDFTNDVTEERLVLEEIFTQSGMASGDYDADGDLDLYLCSINGPNKLYRNEGGLKFSDVTAESGEGLDSPDKLSSGGIFADYNADGKMDLYVCNRRGANQLFINQGDGRFKDEAEARGVAADQSTVISAVFDADNDGDLDLYLANYRDSNDANPLTYAYTQGRLGDIKPWYMIELTKQRPQVGKASISATLPEDLQEDFYVDDSGFAHMKPHVNQLLLNDGKGKFSDVTAKAGLDQPAWSFQPVASDFNDDGFIDIYVSSDFEFPDRLWMNNGDGTFTNKAPEMTRKSPLLSMGADSGDLNGDGLIDLYTSDMLSPDYKRAKRQSGDMNQWRWELINIRPQPQMRNMLFLNRGQGYMTELGQYSGVAATDWTWSVRIADLNYDTLPELFVTNGNLHDTFDVDNLNERIKMRERGVPIKQIQEYFFNMPGYMTDDVVFTASEPLKYDKAPDNWGIKDGAMSCGASLADYDGDGDIDIIVNNTNLPVDVWRNDMDNGNCVLLDLRQEGRNPEAVGAKVYVECAGQQVVQEVVLARGFATGESSRLHIGLGAADRIDRLTVRWPDHKTQSYSGLEVNKRYVIKRAKRLGDWAAPGEAPLFTQKTLPFQQTERNTLVAEFDEEPLLPLQQSALGTGLGVADYDGDGLLDVYCAGPAGQSGALLKNAGASPGERPDFRPQDEAIRDMDPNVEEMSALWLDSDGTGSPDLLVSAGGTEAMPSSREFEGSLLGNTGQSFARIALPGLRNSRGSMCAADVDRDGDVDVFVAGHLQPHKFAATAPSDFYENEQGRLRPALAARVPALVDEAETNGQIAEAQFCDVDGDGWPDLLLARQWGPLELLRNEQGVFRTRMSLSDKGWWRSLCIGDFDGDGDPDFIAGNNGKNSKYSPKEGAPVTLFANDFDGNGTRDLIEVKYRKDGCMLPGRGRSCSGYAVGYIPQRFPTWASFADATLEDVYGQGLATAQRYEVTAVEHVVAINDGKGGFSLSPLPRYAQLAPAFGITAGDFNNDGKLDAFMANNFTDTQPETGNWSTGYGTLLLGDGAGSFTVSEPWQSGSYIWQDARTAISADVNKDGALDVLVSCSNAPAQILLGRPGGKSLSVSLQGKAPNTGAIGAKLSLSLSDGSTLTRFVQAGQGYLGSYLGPQHFGLPEGVTAQKLVVTWPDGSSSESTELALESLSIAQP
ncbi:VCBS repeat-containing protein [bacterium]|nr:VCBS repeat-containing protein [bacterium]